MCGSGVRITIAVTFQRLQKMEVHRPYENAENDAYSIFRAVPGSIIRGLAAPLVAPRTTPLTVRTLLVFVWSIAPQGLNLSPYY